MNKKTIKALKIIGEGWGINTMEELLKELDGDTTLVGKEYDLDIEFNDDETEIESVSKIPYPEYEELDLEEDE